jgi:hypothetical protein
MHKVRLFMLGLIVVVMSLGCLVGQLEAEQGKWTQKGETSFEIV